MFGSGCATRAARLAGVAIALSLALGACGSHKKEVFQRSPDVSRQEAGERDQGSIFGKLNLFSSTKPDSAPGVAVNAFLWRAALDTVAFMPLASADPFGGTIITDWYSLPETPDERFKVNVYILGRALRADGIKVSVFRQTRDSAGHWNDSATASEVNSDFEDAVLSRARELRLQAVNEKS